MSTIIAAEGKIYADRQWIVGGYEVRGTKLHKIGNSVLGISWSGPNSDCLFLSWYKKEEVELVELDFDALEVTSEGGIYHYLGRDKAIGGPAEVQQDYMAIGSGREFALTALHLGKTPEEAIKIASELDIYTGSEIEIVSP